MQAGSKEARRYVLGLLLAGLSPEEAEAHLAGRLVQQEAHSALTDPINDPVMREVPAMAQPTRGPVEILGVTTRTNTSNNRYCASEECMVGLIEIGKRYERVARDEETIECYHPICFVNEFGERGLYGV